MLPNWVGCPGEPSEWACSKQTSTTSPHLQNNRCNSVIDQLHGGQSIYCPKNFKQHPFTSTPHQHTHTHTHISTIFHRRVKQAGILDPTRIAHGKILSLSKTIIAFKQQTQNLSTPRFLCEANPPSWTSLPKWRKQSLGARALC